MAAMLDEAYRSMEGSAVLQSYTARHGISSQAVLTVTDDNIADLVAGALAPRIEGRTVVEIGGGIGLLAMHMGRYAKRVFCIEANPVWSSSFVAIMMEQKPKNVSYLFGSAEEFQGLFQADIAIFCTHSGVDSMRAAAAAFAPIVVDVYGELIASNPEAFDPVARRLRTVA